MNFIQTHAALWKGRAKNFWEDFTKPLNSIKNQPRQYTAWFLIANVVGLAGFWLPIFSVWYRGNAVSPVFQQLVESGALASFSVVILADGIATSMSAIGGSNMAAAGIRGQAGAGAIILLMLQAVILYNELSPRDGEHPKHVVQILLTVFAIGWASYLYCFRFPDWEKTCAEVKKEEEDDVEKMKNAAQNKANDGKGVAT